jgi:hypothetical protein
MAALVQHEVKGTFHRKECKERNNVGAGLIPPFFLFASFAVIESLQSRFGGEPA